jgi:hypothetical protein
MTFLGCLVMLCECHGHKPAQQQLKPFASYEFSVRTGGDDLVNGPLLRQCARMHGCRLGLQYLAGSFSSSYAIADDKTVAPKMPKAGVL